MIPIIQCQIITNRITLSLSIQLRSKHKNSKNTKNNYQTLGFQKIKFIINLMNSLRFSEIQAWIIIIESRFLCNSSPNSSQTQRTGRSQRGFEVRRRKIEAELNQWRRRREEHRFIFGSNLPEAFTDLLFESPIQNSGNHKNLLIFIAKAQRRFIGTDKRWIKVDKQVSGLVLSKTLQKMKTEP